MSGQIPLEEIKRGTDNFHERNFLGQGGFGKVYKGKLAESRGYGTVAVKRLDLKLGQGKTEFFNEIAMLSNYRHPNLVSLIGSCGEAGEMILVYQYAIHGSLDKYLTNTSDSTNNLTWVQRLKICVGAALGLNYLHTGVGQKHRVIHRDVKSSNILLDENWEARVSDFGLSKIGHANQDITFLFSNPAGTFGYCDPQYIDTGILTKKSDVYSFGVVLFEVLCGRPALVAEYIPERQSLAQLARRCFEEGKLNDIIDRRISKQIESNSLTTFSEIAYRCLQVQRDQRPTMDKVVEELEIALRFQESVEEPSLVTGYDNETGAGEDEDTILDLKGRLFRYEEDVQKWTERCIGTVKLLKHKDTGKVRLVMQQSETLKICLNHLILPTTYVEEFINDDYLCAWHGADYCDGNRRNKLFNMRFGSAQDCKMFVQTVDNIAESQRN